MFPCNFCQKQDDFRDMRIYNTCNIVGGEPCVPCTEYMEIEAQIEKTRQTLEEQLGRRREMREKINRLHDPMLRRMPREITTYIFELAASVDVPTEGAKSEDALREGELYAPLPLGSVCGAWRGIAWDMPQLWSFMPARIRTVEQIPSRLEGAKQWLDRTGDYLPLSIYFRINETYHDYSDKWDEFIPFIDLLTRYCHRWKDLCGLCTPILLRHLTRRVHGVPMLQNLQLSAPRFAEIEKIFSLADGHLAQPRSLRLDNYIFLTVDIGVDWGHVTRLKLDTFSVTLFLELLPLLRNLQDLGIYGMIEDLSGDTSLVEHHKVETFYVDCRDADGLIEDLCDFLNCLAFPSLQHLTINLLHNIDLHTTIISLLQRSSCKLTSLSLHSNPLYSNHSMMNLLVHLDSLRNLEIMATSIDDENFPLDLIRALQQHQLSGSRPYLLVNLERFTYNDQYGMRIPWHSLVELFDSNWRANRPSWRTLSVKFRSLNFEAPTPGRFSVPPGLNEETMGKLLELVEAGIEVILPGRWREAIKPKPVTTNELDEI